jgi:hypothetical protein
MITGMEHPLSTSSPRRIGFYPCCCGDIEEPRRILASLVDEILFCDKERSKEWDQVRDEPGLPKATFLQGDVCKLIDTLPTLRVLLYRNDSGCEGGSNLKILGRELLPRILQRFDPEGGWIFSDGSNGGKALRSLLSEDWHTKPTHGCEFRKVDGFELSNRNGNPVHAVEVRPMPIKPKIARPGWVPPRDNRFTSPDTLWDYCTASNRVAPLPPQWNQLYSMLKHTRRKASGGWEPPLPLVLSAWHHSTPIDKQLRFHEHLRWAVEQGQLAEIGTFLGSLPETQWCHFGEI